MFEIVGTKSLDSNAIDFVDSGINFVGRTFENNGIQGEIEKRDFEPNEPYTITATVIGNYKYVKYQKEPYYCSQNINKLTPKSILKKWNEQIAYFMITNIQKFVSLYDYQQGGYKLEDIKNHIIKLPINNHNEIDFDFMESLISELEEERIRELTAYLTVSGLDNYTLTSEEKKAIADYENITFKYYKIEDLFTLKSSAKKINANTIEFTGKYPYVARTSNNNGIRGYIDYDKKYLNKAKTISFGQDTATIFYQKDAYFTGDKIKVLDYKNDELTSQLACYYITSMNKAFQSFAWGQSSFNEKILKSMTISLPTRNGKIDIESMNTFISAIHKLVIKNVVEYTDKKLNLTKELVYGEEEMDYNLKAAEDEEKYE